MAAAAAGGSPGDNSNSNSKCFSVPPDLIHQLSCSVAETLAATPYNPPPHSLSIKSLLQSLLQQQQQHQQQLITNFFLCLATLASASHERDSPTLCWITPHLALSAHLALHRFCQAASYASLPQMVADFFPHIVPHLKTAIKDTCVPDPDARNEQLFASPKPVAYSILAAHQFRWMVSQVLHPLLPNFCPLLIPCALTALDHWSPQVKEQGMLTFIHITNNVAPADFSWYEEAVLDACCRSIPATDQLWYRVVQLSVLLLTHTHKSNPRSPWFDRMLSEMLGHLERQPFNKERRQAWLSLIEPVFDAMGLFVLAHFRLLFSLFFQWMHADDDETVNLVLERLNTIVKLTWIRQSPHTERLVDELVLIYKESATRKNRELLRSRILQLLSLLQRCKGVQFESIWEKHTHDPDLVMLMSSFNSQQVQIIGS